VAAGGPGDQVTAVMPPHVGLAVTLPVPARQEQTQPAQTS